ncbi:aspartic peptidase domain-containing protein [Diplogelasinospora grovesii]|uniref:Aspartic peptidase domain-containing protein n=1 Tax=Diplogelasinospora grovesii TaxID=303347 RepID=A0AAN6N6Y2_9PEZI|nr:aspartic peptidase domain-containing protein [Diplogelasinospora grovesii]
MKFTLCLAVQVSLSLARVLNAGLHSTAQRSGPANVNVPLTDWMRGDIDLQWHGTIEVGTPPRCKYQPTYQVLCNVMFDTGSTGVLLPRSNCATCGPSKSATFSQQPATPMNIQFGTGGDTIPLSAPQGANCTVVTDAVSIAGLTSPKQEFKLCDVYAATLASQPADGILGLGSSNPSNWDNINTFQPLLFGLFNNSQIPNPIFSLSYVPGQKNGSELTLGGTNPSRYDRGGLATMVVRLDGPLSEATQSWVVDVSAVYIGGQPLRNSSNSNQPLSPSVALLDSDTAYILMPDLQTTRDLYAQPIDNLGSWGASCKTLDSAARDVTISLGNEGGQMVNVTVPEKFFNLGEYPGKRGVCQAVFLNPPNPAREPFQRRSAWVLGSPLLKNYYTI